MTQAVARCRAVWATLFPAALVFATLASASLGYGQEIPSLGITSPAPNSAITGPDVTVEVAVTDFTLVPPSGTDDTPGQGHLIYYLDFEPPFIPGQPAIPDDPDVVYAATHETSYTFQDVPPGLHDVVVLLVLDNHAPVFPPAIDKVSFTVVAPEETQKPQPTPVVTETARSIDVQPEPHGSDPSLSPSPAVLPVQVPPTGIAPAGSGGFDTWLLAGAVIGVVAGASATAALWWLRQRD